MDYRWNFKPTPSSETVGTLTRDLGISTSLAQLLAQRNVSTFEEAKYFFRPQLEDLHDPFLMKGMEKSVLRLQQAIENDENILIYGDYDVDGSCSVALFYSFLKNYTDHLAYYIPDRYTEGYGISAQGIAFAQDNGVDLIITLDCGIRAINTLAEAKRSGIDVIVCDHHLPGEQLPEAYAILNPKQSDCPYPFKELCGCGVGFKLLQGFVNRFNIDAQTLLEHLDLVAVATAADIVSMSGENRILTYYGLIQLNQTQKPGLQQLINRSGYSLPLTVSNVVFGIAPRINAAGRIKHAKYAVEILIETDLAIAETNTNRIEEFNSQRKAEDQGTTTEALAMLYDYQNEYSTVLFQENWHKGVIGIVASRCIEQYYRPTIILTESNGVVSGSARSVQNFDIHEAIGQCDDLLEQYGGHQFAAGLVMKKENVPLFQERFEEVVKQTIDKNDLIPEWKIDLELAFHEITPKFYRILSQMAPFGPDNMQPLFASHHVRDTGRSRLLKNDHVKLHVQQDGVEMEGIAFNFGHLYTRIQSGELFSICYEVQENNYRGNKTLQLFIKDIRFDLKN